MNGRSHFSKLRILFQRKAKLPGTEDERLKKKKSFDEDSLDIK